MGVVVRRTPVFLVLFAILTLKQLLFHVLRPEYQHRLPLLLLLFLLPQVLNHGRLEQILGDLALGTGGAPTPNQV